MFKIAKNILENCTIKRLNFPYKVNVRQLSISVDDFNKAKDRVNKLKNDPGSENKLKLYALFKQVTEGKCNTPKPSMINFVNLAKWEAWSSLSQMTKESAIDTYVKLVDELCKQYGEMDDKSVSSSGEKGDNKTPQVEGIDVTNNNGVLTIRLNRIQKKNALTWEMYDFWAETLNRADKDPSISVVVVTGAGDYFCSGNDLSNFTKMKPGETPQEMALKGKKVLQNFVASFIDFSKPLIGLINGPAIGITVTTLGLYDMVIASDNATFSTPFSNLGQTPEGCSSYTFPAIFGPMKANNILIFNKKLSANEAIGLVTYVFPDKVFHEEAWKIVNEIASLPPQTVKYSKDLIRGPLRKKLHDTNEIECNRLTERWLSDECMRALTKFFSKK